MSRIHGLAVGVGLAALIVVGLGCGDGNAPTPTESSNPFSGATDGIVDVIVDKLFSDLLPWSPTPQQTDYTITDMKYHLIEHFDGALVGNPVIVPQHVRLEQARSAFSTMLILGPFMLAVL